MITPEYLNELMYAVEDSLESVNLYILKKMIKRILISFTNKSGNLFIPATINDLRKLMNNGVLLEEIQEALEKALPGIKKEIKKAFLQAADEISMQNYNMATEIFKAEKMASFVIPAFEQVGIVEEASALDMTPAEIRRLEAAYKRTNGEMVNMTRTMPRIAIESYTKACDNAYMKVQSGVSIQTAVVEAIKEVSDRGLEIEYRGRTDKIEVAIARAVRTGVNQSNSEIVLQRCAEMGVGYVKVSAHMGARVTNADDYTNHSWWQGRVYSLDWNSDILKEYSSNVGSDDSDRFDWLAKMREAMPKRKEKYPDFVETCGYGDILGIAGINCRHSFYPFYPGVQTADDTRPDMEENAKRYALDQKQRAMERAIRKTKREYLMLKDNKQDTDAWASAFKASKDRLQAQSDKYMQFCKDNGLKPRNMSLQVAKDIPKTKLLTKSNRGTIDMNLQLFANKDKQYGKKIGKHASDFGLDPSLKEDRAKMMDIIKDIMDNKTSLKIGKWSGQDEDVLFHIKGNDVVITKQNMEFVTVLKDGVLNSARVKNAREK